MGKILWVQLSRGGAVIAGLVGLIAPKMVGEAYRDRQEQINMDADAAFAQNVIHYRSKVGSTPVDEVECWNRDFAWVARYLRVSFANSKEKANV